MSKKILSVVLALVLVMSVFATTAFAGNTTYEDKETSTYSQTWALAEPVDNGDGTYSVEVSLTTDYPTGAIQFQIVETDANDVIALDSVALGSAIGYSAQITKGASGKVFIIPQTTADDNMVEATAIDGVIATLTYTYTGSGSADIAINNDPKTEDNVDGTLVATRMAEGNIAADDFVVGQIVNSTGETRTIGTASADPELIAKSGTTGYVDNTRMYVYGVDLEANPLNYFEATNNGYIEMSEGTASVTNGTGATLTLYNQGGNVVATYTLVIFGDVDGDGIINMADSDAINQEIYGVSELEGAPAFAADVDADSIINMADSDAINQQIYGVGEIAANVWAA